MSLLRKLTFGPPTPLPDRQAGLGPLPARLRHSGGKGKSARIVFQLIVRWGLGVRERLFGVDTIVKLDQHV